MKFLLSCLLSLLLSTVVLSQSPSSQQCSQWVANEAIYQGHFSPACKVLTSACIQRITTCPGVVQLWSDHVCVAAATCQGTEKTIGIGSCLNSEIASLGHEGLFSITIDVWNQQVAPYCSTAPGRCPVSRQNFIDFIYRTLDVTLGSGVWPDAQTEVIDLWWDALVQWGGASATPDRVDYGVFNDWLRNSHSQ
ncbi:hypothetical protein Moror_2434 [Moniliophthora roreri MCA 2997]|uniref:Uncharacterized protein n=2 Tax=Moniliophthora roreri TaxID=221103 RepID=V2WW37_MONRO|nr:hypothetical protein Moror_2434 [Moniliophthora roreri MCA 2997]KAI3605499.1 hypothetical protein WG66_005918 [Moniliophthora roreri]